MKKMRVCLRMWGLFGLLGCANLACSSNSLGAEVKPADVFLSFQLACVQNDVAACRAIVNLEKKRVGRSKDRDFALLEKLVLFSTRKTTVSVANHLFDRAACLVMKLYNAAKKGDSKHLPLYLSLCDELVEQPSFIATEVAVRYGQVKLVKSFLEKGVCKTKEQADLLIAVAHRFKQEAIEKAIKLDFEEKEGVDKASERATQFLRRIIWWAGVGVLVSRFLITGEQVLSGRPRSIDQSVEISGQKTPLKEELEALVVEHKLPNFIAPLNVVENPFLSSNLAVWKNELTVGGRFGKLSNETKVMLLLHEMGHLYYKHPDLTAVLIKLCAPLVLSCALLSGRRIDRLLGISPTLWNILIRNALVDFLIVSYLFSLQYRVYEKEADLFSAHNAPDEQHLQALIRCFRENFLLSRLGLGGGLLESITDVMLVPAWPIMQFLDWIVDPAHPSSSSRINYLEEYAKTARYHVRDNSFLQGQCTVNRWEEVPQLPGLVSIALPAFIEWCYAFYCSR